MWRFRKLARAVRIKRLEWRDGGRLCHYCRCVMSGSRNRQRTIDHRVPKSKGGTNRLSNLVFACGACNRKKGDMTEAEFLQLDWLEKRRVIVAWELGQHLRLVKHGGVRESG
jgi:5-methylcytosine-specific restriction endonuclease McrA